MQHVCPSEVPSSCSRILFSGWQQKRASFQRWSTPYAHSLFRLLLQFVLTHGSPVEPSMFGRNLIEQVRADAKGEGRYVPVIVEKCIDAVDALGEFIEFFRHVS